MTNPAMQIVDLEGRLAADKSGALRDELCRSLEEELAGVKRQVAAGLPPPEFAASDKWQQAVPEAVAVAPPYSEGRSQSWKPTGGPGMAACRDSCVHRRL